MLVGQQAPYFSARAYVNGEIIPDFSLDQYKGKKYVLLVFYPKNFTSICQSELLAFQAQLADFEARDTAVSPAPPTRQTSMPRLRAFPLQLAVSKA